MKWKSGFTVMELLTVMAIIGIIAGILSYNVYQGVLDRRLTEAAQQVVSDLRLARLKAQTTAVGSAAALCSTPTASCATSPAQPSQTYSVVYGGLTPQVRTLPYQIRIAGAVLNGTTYANNLTYSAPYAEIPAGGTIWRLVDRRGRERFVRVTGVTGKVSLSASIN